MKTRMLRDIEVSEVGMGCMVLALRVSIRRSAVIWKDPLTDCRRIMENLDSAYVELTDEEFSALERSLNGLKVYGHRGLGGF